MPTMPTKKPKPVSKVLPSAARKAAARPRPPVEDEEDEAAPPRRPAKAGGVKKAAASAVQEGWDGAENQMSDPDWPMPPKVEKGQTFYFRFLQDKPYASVRMHWIDEMKGKKSFVCPQTADCPLCELGDTPKADIRFNIAELGEEMPKLRTLNVGQSQADDFKSKHNDKRYGPLSSRFYSRKRPSGPGARWKTEVFRRDSDLEEEIEALDLKIYIPTVEEMEELGLWTKEDALKEINMDELTKAAAFLAGDYDDDD